MDLHDNLSVRILRTILLVTIAWKWSNAQLPCHFDDSVNITAGDPEDGDSIRFNNMLYPNGTYAEIDYTITNGTSQPAAAHIRGCPCLIRPCVRLCCPYGSFVSNKSTDENIICEKYDGLYKGIFGNLTDNNHNITINFDDHFAYLDRSFDKNFFAEMFQLSKAGYFLFDYKWLSHSEYCLKIVNATAHPEALICWGDDDSVSDPNQNPKPKNVAAFSLPYGMLLSVVFLAATFAVYIFIFEMKHFHGRCFLYFSFSLLLYFSTMTWASYSDFKSTTTRKIFAAFIYFIYLSAALCLNVIIFDVYNMLRGYHESKQFLKRNQRYFYRIYVYMFGIPSIFTATGIWFDSLKSILNYLQPGFGVNNFFLKDTPWWSIGLFLFFPLFAISIANLTLFILTMQVIGELKKDTGYNEEQPLQPSDDESKLDKAKQCFFLGSQLFGLMGGFWLLDAIYSLTKDPKFYVYSEISHSLLGVVVFLLFVLNPRVKSAIEINYNKIIVPWAQIVVNFVMKPFTSAAPNNH